eukprot:GHVN01033947.1.p1 GENE.GHVN01033947.1~~GHVN01033947.1.p1  ORF type:complete len:209 (+),score=3.54 GHVN01033947.1:127-753(+)
MTMPTLVVPPASQQATQQQPAQDKLKRSKSIEAYQRSIINRIKEHFHRNRDDWERKLRPRRNKKLDHSESTPEDLVTKTSYSPNSSDAYSSSHTPSISCNRLPSVRVLRTQSTETTNLNGTTNIIQITVDISPFLPDGEVTFRTEKDRLVVCARFPSNATSRTVKKVKDEEKVKVIPVPGLLESERIRVLPASIHGAMIVELKVAKKL